MKERPILFSAPMVRALLAGTKKQTRRVLKTQPNEHHWQMLPGYELKRSDMVTIDGRAAVKFSHSIPQNRGWDDATSWVRCPYGIPGDRLWVREAWRSGKLTDRFPPREMTPHVVWYEADGAAPEATNGRYRPGMFMPRWASRITLEITEVRVERLQSISPDDAIAEGLQWDKHIGWGTWDADGSPRCGGDHDPVDVYRCLWTNINGNGSWELNPWVWVVAFRRLAC